MSEPSERPSFALPLWAVAILVVVAFLSGGVTVADIFAYTASNLAAKSSNPNDYVYPGGEPPAALPSTPPMPPLLPNADNLRLVSVFRVIDEDHDAIYYQAVATVDDASFTKKAAQVHWKPIPHRPNSLPDISVSKQAFTTLLTKNQQKALTCYASEHPKAELHYGIDSAGTSESVHDRGGNTVPSRDRGVEGMTITPACQSIDTTVDNEAVLVLGTVTIAGGQDVPTSPYDGTQCPPGANANTDPQDCIPNSVLAPVW